MIYMYVINYYNTTSNYDFSISFLYLAFRGDIFMMAFQFDKRVSSVSFEDEWNDVN